MTSDQDADRRFDELYRRLEGEDHQDERPRRVPRYPEDDAAPRCWPAVAVDTSTGDRVRRGVAVEPAPGEPRTFIPYEPFDTGIEHAIKVRAEAPCVPLDEGMPAIEDAYASERDVVSPPRASLEDVPLRGLLRIAWAETRAGLRDAWRRLASAIKDGV